MPHKSLGLCVNWVTEYAQAKAGDPLIGVLKDVLSRGLVYMVVGKR